MWQGAATTTNADCCHTHQAAPISPAYDVAIYIKEKYASLLYTPGSLNLFSVQHSPNISSVQRGNVHQKKNVMWQHTSKRSMRRGNIDRKEESILHTWQPQYLQQLGAICHLATSWWPPQASPAAGQNLSAQFLPSCWLAASCLQHLSTSVL